MTIDTKNLRVLMEAACKGPFRHNKDNDQVGDVAFANKDLSYLQIQSLWAGDHKRRDADAAYVAALLNAAPDLLDALERKDNLIRGCLGLLKDPKYQNALIISSVIETLTKELAP